MIKELSTVTLLCVFVCATGFSQVYRPQNEAIVSFACIVSPNDEGTFTYSYIVANSAQSKEVFDHFALYLVDSLLTTNQTLIRGPVNKKWYIDGSYLGNISGSPASRFLGIPPENGLAPGESMAFSFASMGLPSIKPYYAQSFAPPYTTEEYDSLLEAGYTETQLSPDWKDNAYRGVTVAPRVYYSSMMSSLFLDTLLSYTHQSVDLGWLGKTRDDDCDNDEHPQDGIEKNIERRLTMAQRDLQYGDSVKARKDLQTLINKVDRIWKRSQIEEKKHEHDRGDWWQHRKDWVIMTSEAYALLKYNTEYLIDRLPERERRFKGSNR